MLYINKNVSCSRGNDLNEQREGKSKGNEGCVSIDFISLMRSRSDSGKTDSVTRDGRHEQNFKKRDQRQKRAEKRKAKEARKLNERINQSKIRIKVCYLDHTPFFCPTVRF